MQCVNILNGKVTERDFQTALEVEVDPKVAPMDDFNITETAYIPPQVQIKEFMEAGARLDAERRARFDNRELNLDPEDDIPLDLARDPNVDVVDMQRAARSANERIEKTKRQIAAEAAEAARSKDTAGASKVDPGASSGDVK